jgi:Reverse transcriptase (RNA-dependent DNA polymerase).
LVGSDAVVPEVVEQSAPAVEEFKTKEEDENNDEDTHEYYSSYYCSMPGELNIQDRRLLDHLEWQSKLVEEGLTTLSQNQISFLVQRDRAYRGQKWTRQDADFVFCGPWQEDVCFYIDIFTGEALRVDKDTDILTQAELEEHWEAVQESDDKELRQFVKEKMWNLGPGAAAWNIVDAVWVRKWKRNPDGTYKIKSRLCARGFLDRQVPHLTTRATTSTKLSPKLILSLSVIFDLKLETWDVSGAFLKGFPFPELRRKLQARGINTPERHVVLRPPSDVYQKLAKIPGSRVYTKTINLGWVLWLLKLMYV